MIEQDFNTGLVASDMEAGGISVYAREQHELQAAFLVAMNRPRDENAAFVRISKSCERPTFAEKARYSFRRSSTAIEGPSVNLAREMARCWGNIRHGIRIVSMDDDWVQVEGWALDLETNTRVGNESKFKRLVQRKNWKSGGTDWVRPDERDLRELVNKHGAICVRNALLQLIPADVVEDAMMKVFDTLDRAARGDLQQNREETIRRLVLAFDRLSVSVEMIENRIGHKLSEITKDELVELRGVYQSMADGNSRRDEHFESTKPAAKADAPLKGKVSLGSLKPGEAPETKPDPKPATSDSLSDEEKAVIEAEEARLAAQADAEAGAERIPPLGTPEYEEYCARMDADDEAKFQRQQAEREAAEKHRGKKGALIDNDDPSRTLGWTPTMRRSSSASRQNARPPRSTEGKKAR